MKLKLIPAKTYKTEATAEKAALKAIEKTGMVLRFMICWNEEGRAYPVFIGEDAVIAGVLFDGFIVVA